MKTPIIVIVPNEIADDAASIVHQALSATPLLVRDEVGTFGKTLGIFIEEPDVLITSEKERLEKLRYIAVETAITTDYFNLQYEQDKTMSVADLAATHLRLTGSHPIFTREMWRHRVTFSSMDLGYWSWAANCLRDEDMVAVFKTAVDKTRALINPPPQQPVEEKKD